MPPLTANANMSRYYPRVPLSSVAIVCLLPFGNETPSVGIAFPRPFSAAQPGGVLDHQVVIGDGAQRLALAGCDQELCPRALPSCGICSPATRATTRHFACAPRPTRRPLPRSPRAGSRREGDGSNGRPVRRLGPPYIFGDCASAIAIFRASVVINSVWVRSFKCRLSSTIRLMQTQT
jgi:hypothetical protein